MYTQKKKPKKKPKKDREKPFLISYEWELDKHPISEADLLSKHPEIDLIVRSLSWDETFLLKVGSPGSIITIESNWH